MKVLYILSITFLMNQADLILYDFNTVETSGKWYAVNDNVMGGISDSNIKLNKNGTATFTGMVSLENNGGFASIRFPLNEGLEENLKGVILRLKGDGNIYNIRFRTNNNFDGYAYESKIQTKKDSWEEFRIPFKNFKPTFRGYTLNNKPMLESQNIVQIGILIAEKQSGEFSIDMDWVKFYY